MKATWEKVWKQLDKTEAALNEFLANGGLSSIALSKSKAFIKEWNSYKKQVTDFDQFISPVEPLDVKSPFKTEAVIEMWKRWKNYLAEQHGQSMGSCSEQSALEQLHEFAKGDEEKAVKFLRYAMTNRYKNFFSIEEKDMKQPAKGDTGSGTGSDF
jgi:hypothetical protein